MTHIRKPPAASLLDFAHALADLSATPILRHFRKPLAVHNKAEDGAFDPVTVADRAAERAIRAAIAKNFPEHGILGEELAPLAGTGRYQWVVDPIDGTRAFIMGSQQYVTEASPASGSKQNHVLLAYYVTPQYTASSAISLEPRTRMVNTQALLTTPDRIEQVPYDHTTIETEVKLLGSRSFAHYAIEALDLLDDPEFNPRRHAQQEEAAGAEAEGPPAEGFQAFMAEYVYPIAAWVPDFLAGRDRPRQSGPSGRRARSVRAADRARECASIPCSAI